MLLPTWNNAPSYMKKFQLNSSNLWMVYYLFLNKTKVKFMDGTWRSIFE